MGWLTVEATKIKSVNKVQRLAGRSIPNNVPRKGTSSFLHQLHKYL